jgi:aspartyl-tRNA(Asn)/glutamyl-tRNA(Gln) amidotransferase subunit A
MYREGAMRPTELVDSIIQRIEETEPKVKAYAAVFEAEAKSQARIADRELREGRALGPLHGIPVSIKDMIDVKGKKSSAGSKALSNYVAAADATVVRKLREVGAIILGKTTTHEFALGVQTPPTRNPWDLSKIPGGSSGGSAAALASGSALGALGTDTAGSVRIPSALCGTVGIKPSYGRVSRRGLIPASWSFDHIGPMAKTVEDCALLLNAISGRDEEDVATVKLPEVDFTTSIRDGIEGMKIGVPENYFFERVSPEMKSKVNGAVRILEKLGAELTYFRFPAIEELTAAQAIIDSAETSAYHLDLFRGHAADYTEESRAYVEEGFFIPAVQYVLAQRTRKSTFKKIDGTLRTMAAMVCPTVPVTAPNYGAPEVVISGVKEGVTPALCRLTGPFNFTGHPSISVPCGFSASGLPIGLQIVGNIFDEAKVFRIAYAYESATEWHEARPPVTTL